MFFREFDIPLKEIKAVLKNPALEKNQILRMQRKMLTAKKERIERLIASIDAILKGENAMDFEVFSKTELEDLYRSMEENMNEDQKALFIEQYGSMSAWKEHFLKNASSKEAQQNFQKVVEWHGSKEKALEVTRNPGNPDSFSAYQKQMDSVLRKLAARKGQDADSPEVRKLAEEYDFVTRQMFRLPDASAMVLELAAAYQTNPEIQAAQDRVYGEGSTEFIGRALEAFYNRPARRLGAE